MKSASILILTYGTRGDVEPFIAIALRLKNRGHSVTLATAEQFATWINSFGLNFAPLSDALLEVMHSADGKILLEGTASFLNRVLSGIRLARKSRLLNSQLCTDSWLAAQTSKPDLILFHPKVVAGPHIAEALGVPALFGVLQPMIVPTAAFPVTGLPELSLPGYNRFTYRLVAMSYATYRKSVNSFRERELGLNPVRRTREILFPPGAKVKKVLHGVSAHVIPRPKDWPPEADMSGYWSLPPDPTYTPPTALAEFLSSGEAPVYIGFGSMVSGDPAILARIVVEALKLAGVRGVIGSGWAGLNAQSDNIVTVKDVPHDWLFPRMSAVVHHGGAGTTAAGFRAGVPSVICPFFGDQPGWANKSFKLGVGTPPVPRKQLSPERLAQSIQTAISDPALAKRAKNLAAVLGKEDGVGLAVTAVEQELFGDNTEVPLDS